MKKEELVKAITYLGVAYGKEYSQLEIEQIYDFVKEYNNETFVKAIKNIIRTSKFVPKIADLVEECENCKSYTKNEVIKYMKDIGYFNYGSSGYELDEAHAQRNYLKTLMWIERGIVPDWLQEDINAYYCKMQQLKLSGSTNKMIS